MNELYSVIEVGRNIGLTFLTEALTPLFGDALEHVTVTDFFETEENGTRTYSVVFAVKESILVSIPGFEVIRLGVVRDSEDEWPLIYCEVTIGPSGQSLSIRHFPLRIEIENPYLQPVEIEEGSPVLENVSFEIEGSFTVSSEFEITARLEKFSVPPFEIVGTGLRLALEECRLITRGDDVDFSITALGFNQEFRGLHAQSALLHWRLPVQLEGNDLPGIRANFENIVLGNQGVSVSANLSWPVVFQGGQFDSAQTEILGFFIDSDWRFALASLSVGIQANIPNAVGAGGSVRIPFLDAIFGLDFFVSYAGDDAYELQGSLSLGDGQTVLMPLGAGYQVELRDFNISGRIEGDDRFDFEGSTGCRIDLPGLIVKVERATLKLEHRPNGDTYQLQIAQVEIENVGSFDASELIIVSQRTDDGDITLKSFQLETTVIWSDISDQIALSQVPAEFPLPPDDARLTLKIRWAGDEMQLSLKAELEDVDQLWRFIPQDQRPRVAEASIDIELTKAGDDFRGELGLALRLQLPAINSLPGLVNAGLGDLVQMDTGDPEGWIDLTFKAELASDGNSNSGSLAAVLERPLILRFNLPGLVLPAPPLELSLSEISLELSTEAEQSEGEFQFKGGFVLRPILPSDLGGLVPSPMAAQLERLLAIAHLYDLQGTVVLTLGISEDAGYCALRCEFDSAGLELDLFDLLAGVSSSLPATAGGQTEQIDLDIDVSLQLMTLTLSVGQVPDADENDADLPFSFGLTATLGFAGQSTEMSFELSPESFSFGFNELALPIALPQLPLRRSDPNETALDDLRNGEGRWDMDVWQTGLEPRLDAELIADGAALAQARADLEQLETNAQNDENRIAQQLFELRFRTIPALQKKVFHNTGKKFLIEAILAVHQILGNLSSQSSQDSYQGLVELYQSAVDLTLGSLQFDTGLQFVIRDAQFVLPFNDPSGIRAEGGASLQGFAPDSPLKPLEDLVFKLGVSSDAITFSVEGGADPIPLPDFGRYPGNAVTFDRLIIGYGYSKNSLLIDFVGELQLSPALIEDVDTSRRLGVGLRLPSNNRLKLKLDLIPITLGEVSFLLPLVAFDINLRSENPPLAPPSADCVPAWDGLQFIVPGILRADFKRFKFSPFFGPLPAPNVLMAYDVDVGDKQLGLTLICDNYQVITPLLGQSPIPFLADSSPFFDQLCTNLRLGGFGINFELRRPFPSPDPLLIFELMSFLADPSLPIDLAGRLANLMWAELSNARITLPPAVLGMFPEQGSMLTRELNVRVNVGVVIALAQQLTRLTDDLQQRLAQTGNDLVGLIDDLRQNPPSVLLSELLSVLPRALRRVELNGSFVGFEASAVFLLTTPEALHAQLQPPPVEDPPPPLSGLRWVNVATDSFRRNPLRNWRSVNYGLKRGRVGDWRIRQGALWQENNVGDNSPGRYGAMLIRETELLDEFRVTVDLQSADNDGIGVLFYVLAKDTFYRFRMTSEQEEWHLMRLKKGVRRVLYKSASAFQLGKTYRVRIEARSVPQSSAGPLDRFDFRNIAENKAARSSRSKKQRFTTYIRIWVNEALWCDIADTDMPLTEGQVGLDSWWNTGAQFDNFSLDRGERVALDLTHAATVSLARNVVPMVSQHNVVMPEGTLTSAWLTDDLVGFSDEDLLLAIPRTNRSAVVVAARIKLLGKQTYRFIGTMQMDGRFQLLTTVNIAPLKLSVAGVALDFPLTLKGRVSLEGHSAGADSWARFRAELYGDWDLLLAPGGALARLIIGSESQPARIVAESREWFEVQGDGELQLFANQLRITGRVDITQQHVFVHGELVFIHAQSIPVFQLSMTTEGRVGPGSYFLLSGRGELTLLGRTFSSVSGEISADGLMLETRLDVDSSIWSIRGFELHEVEMTLQGRVNFEGAVPDILLEGSGGLRIADVQVKGDCYISVNAERWCLGASGRLNWQGRDWLQGAVELCDDRLSVQGQTQFVLDLTSKLPGNIQIAGLVLSATLGGSFSLRSSGRLAACRFTLDWTVAIRLSDSQAEQSLPIASQRLQIDKPNLSSRSIVTLAELIDIDGLTLFSLDGVTIPVPTLSSTETTDIYIHPSVNIDPDPVTLPISLLTTESTGPDGSPNDPAILGFYTYTPSVNIPEFTLPIPVLSNEAPEDDTGAEPLVSIPELNLADTPLSGEVKLANLKLKLKLQWKNGKLGVFVVAGRGSEKLEEFVSFDNLLPSQGMSTVMGLL